MVWIRCVIAISVIGINLYPCIPDSILIYRTGGGPFGFGIMLIPMLSFLHVTIISAILTFFKDFRSKNRLLLLNVSGLLIGVLYVYMRYC